MSSTFSYNFKSESETPSNFFVLRDYVQDTLSMNLNEKWTDAVLFVSYLTDQILLYEYAETLAVRAFLRIAKLKYQLEQRPNAEFMSPTGKLPFLKLQNKLVAGFSAIVEFGIRLSDTLTDFEKADLQAHVSLIEEILLNAEIYFSWKDSKTYKEVTKKRYASGFLFPLNKIMPFLKQWEMLSYLKKNEWAFKSPEEVLKQCDKCFQALSIKLGTNECFFGDQPTEFDALVFGYLYTIITTERTDYRIRLILHQYQNLLKFCEKIDKEFFY